MRGGQGLADRHHNPNRRGGRFSKPVAWPVSESTAHLPCRLGCTWWLQIRTPISSSSVPSNHSRDSRSSGATAGSCPDGAAPLLKPVVARAGNLVEMSPEGIAVKGHLLPNTAPLENHTNGRPLTSCTPGRYMVGPDSVWVASSYNGRSFDCRYFGPVSLDSVRN